MDTGRFHLSDIFSGADVWGPSPYFDNSAYPSNVTRADLTQLTLLQALAFSDNFTFAHIGLTLGGPTLLRYAHRYLIGRTTPFDYPVAQSWIAKGHARPSTPEVAQSSFGAEVDHVTPMQMGIIAETVANGGVMMAPHLVQDVETASGRVLSRYRVHALSHVMSKRAATDVTTGMIFVVDHGSGYRAQIAGMQVAGKTGTAASGASVPHAWFIAFAPADAPKIALAVLVENGGDLGSEATGGKVSAPIAQKVLVADRVARGW
jgi:peptidoglycan glycosyltransferase